MSHYLDFLSFIIEENDPKNMHMHHEFLSRGLWFSLLLFMIPRQELLQQSDTKIHVKSMSIFANHSKINRKYTGLVLMDQQFGNISCR